MITQLKIENYKSIQDLTLDVGRVNVLIGENGCGKSNILEAITFAAAAEAYKLDNEFLVNRGIRVTEPELMRSSFCKGNLDKEIIIYFKFDDIDFEENYILNNDNNIYSKWIKKYSEQNQGIKKLYDFIQEAELFFNPPDDEFEYDDVEIEKETESKEDISEENREKVLQDLTEKIHESLNNLKSIYLKTLEDRNNLLKTNNGFTVYYNNVDRILNNQLELEKFVIYSPENTSLRNLEKEGQIQPLGINGEGLFKLLTVIQNEAEQSQDFSELTDIQETLELFGWFEKITIPNNHSQLEQKLTIQDRYLEMPFDQRSANEGFLLVLFYITLVVSKYTPKIFAIDNIDTSLNPKLCTKLIKELMRLAKKYDKQIFLTSHNPAILDGIDLGDDEQRLFVVSRNREGHTCCDRIELKDKPKSSIRARLSRIFDENKTYTKAEILEQFDNSDEPLKLSYALLRGYLGGLPENFDL